MGLYQYIREQKHRDDLIGDLGHWMSSHYNQQPDHNSLAFELASREYESCGRWTRRTAIEAFNQNTDLQRIIKIEPRVLDIISEIVKIRIYPGYNHGNEYIRFKAIAVRLVGHCAEKPGVSDIKSYDAVIQLIIDLLPPDVDNLYPYGLPEDIYLDI